MADDLGETELVEVLVVVSPALDRDIEAHARIVVLVQQVESDDTPNDVVGCSSAEERCHPWVQQDGEPRFDGRIPVGRPRLDRHTVRLDAHVEPAALACDAAPEDLVFLTEEDLIVGPTVVTAAIEPQTRVVLIGRVHERPEGTAALGRRKH